MGTGVYGEAGASKRNPNGQVVTPDALWPILIVGIVLLLLSVLPLLQRRKGATDAAFFPVRAVDRTMGGVPVFTVSLEQMHATAPPEQAFLRFHHRARIVDYIPASGVPERLGTYEQIARLTLSIRVLPGDTHPCFLTLILGDSLARISHLERIPRTAIDPLKATCQSLATAANLPLTIDEQPA